MADTNLIAGLVCIIRVKIILFPPPVTAEGESNRPSRHVKQIGRVNVKVRRGQRRLRQVPDRLHEQTRSREYCSQKSAAVKLVNGLYGIVVPIKSEESGSKIESFAFMMRFKRDAEAV